MASKKNSDEVEIDVYVRIKVNGPRWKALMEHHGFDMDGVVIGAHVSKAARATLKREFENLGFPQDHLQEMPR